MLSIRSLSYADRENVLALSKELCEGPAVDHPLSPEVRERSFAAASDGSKLRGFVLEDETGCVGYAYVSQYYCTDVGGLTCMLEELSIAKDARGKGYGTRFISELPALFPEALRFRLEVTEANARAEALYERLGFTRLSYHQLALDV